MHFNKSQITEILSGIISKKNGLNQVLEITVESLMKAERSLHNESTGDVSNGYSKIKALGQKHQLKLSAG